MGRIRIEFTVEPFTEGVLGRYVEAALDALRLAGFEPDVGPFGNSVDGEATTLLPAISTAAGAAFAAGASRLTLSARAIKAPTGDTEDFLAAMRPLARALGATVVEARDAGPNDIPLTWQGQTVGALHAPKTADQAGGLGRLVRQMEEELGEGRLADLSRTAKQRAVRLLDERGAFAFRNAVDEVADAMGVSRVTIYNYLNATRAAPDPVR